MHRRIRTILVAGLASAAMVITAGPAQALDSFSYRDRSKGGQATDYGATVFLSGDVYGTDPTWLTPAYPNNGYLIRERVEAFIFREGAWKHVRAADSTNGYNTDRFELYSSPWSTANSSDLCSYAVNTYSWHYMGQQFNNGSDIRIVATSTGCFGTLHSHYDY